MFEIGCISCTIIVCLYWHILISTSIVSSKSPTKVYEHTTESAVGEAHNEIQSPRRVPSFERQ